MTPQNEVAGWKWVARVEPRPTGTATPRVPAAAVSRPANCNDLPYGSPCLPRLRQSILRKQTEL